MTQLPSVSRAINAVAFDLDGTTLNSEDIYLEVFSRMMRRRGMEYDADTRAGMMGLPAAQAYDVLIKRKNLLEPMSQLIAETHELFDGLLEQMLRPMPGVVELLDFLDQLRLPRCIATSSSHDFADRALQVVGLFNRFDFVITADDVAHGKPHPDIYLAAARQMSCQPEQMLVLEDSPVGVAAGVAANAFVIAVPSEHTIECDFTRANLVVRSMRGFDWQSIQSHR